METNAVSILNRVRKVIFMLNRIDAKRAPHTGAVYSTDQSDLVVAALLSSHNAHIVPLTPSIANTITFAVSSPIMRNICSPQKKAFTIHSTPCFLKNPYCASYIKKRTNEEAASKCKTVIQTNNSKRKQTNSRSQFVTQNKMSSQYIQTFS